MKATLTNYRQSPRKVRLVAQLIRGKSIADARKALTLLDKRSAPAFIKLLNSAVANAKENNEKVEDTLRVADVRVDQGIVFRRFMPRAFGRASVIQKKSSTIKLVLDEKTTPKPKKTAPKKTAKKA
jgi:large subunit ribosomal protein L22